MDDVVTAAVTERRCLRCGCLERLHAPLGPWCAGCGASCGAPPEPPPDPQRARVVAALETYAARLAARRVRP